MKTTEHDLQFVHKMIPEIWCNMLMPLFGTTISICRCATKEICLWFWRYTDREHALPKTSVYQASKAENSNHRIILHCLDMLAL